MVRASHGGRIINIVSLEALHPIAMHSRYGASEAGLVRLTRSLALELVPNKIAVNAIAPVVIWTPGLDLQLRGFYGPAGMTADQLLQATVYPRVPAGPLNETRRSPWPVSAGCDQRSVPECLRPMMAE